MNLAPTLTTGNSKLDGRLVDWLARFEDRGAERAYVQFRGAEVIVCTLLDRGRTYRALSSRHWEDAVANALSIGLDEDFFERSKHGRPEAHPAFTLSLEQWLAYRDEVSP